MQLTPTPAQTQFTHPPDVGGHVGDFVSPVVEASIQGFKDGDSTDMKKTPTTVQIPPPPTVIKEGQVHDVVDSGAVADTPEVTGHDLSPIATVGKKRESKPSGVDTEEDEINRNNVNILEISIPSDGDIGFIANRCPSDARKCVVILLQQDSPAVNAGLRCHDLILKKRRTVPLPNTICLVGYMIYVLINPTLFLDERMTTTKQTNI